MIQSGSGTDARNTVGVSTNEFSHLYHLLGAYWPTRPSVLLRPIGVMIVYLFLTDLELWSLLLYFPSAMYSALG